jgi:hypothetical protein
MNKSAVFVFSIAAPHFSWASAAANRCESAGQIISSPISSLGL